MDLIRELNYVCNSYIFRIAFGLRTVPFSKEERIRVNLWMRKIMTTNKTLSDIRVRNLFLHFLAMNVEAGQFQAPFNEDPTRVPLKALARQLPGQDEIAVNDDESMAMLRFLPAKYGGFMLPKPLPQIGAYCYLTGASPSECTKK